METFYHDYQREEGPFEEGEVLSCQYLDDLPFILSESLHLTGQKYYCAKKCRVRIGNEIFVRKKRYLCKGRKMHETEAVSIELLKDSFLEFEGIQIY